MNKVLILLLSMLFFSFVRAQNFTGQWKGGFVDRSVSLLSWGGDRCDYVLDLDVKGKTVTGFSYTYFTDGGKKYYTICRLRGFADANRKYIEITETERTKTNVPDNISNSFQVHKLKWHKEGENEILEGSWEPAPGQDRSGMGYGTTSLSKRQLTEISSLAKQMNSKKIISAPRSNPGIAFTASKINASQKKITSSLSKEPLNKIPPSLAKIPAKTITKTPVIIAKRDTAQEPKIFVKTSPPAEKFISGNFEKRTNSLLQTIYTENESVKIELYDNGEVDGDSISLFYNGRVLLAHKKLSENPITLEVPVKDDEENELVMYADNLGTIPPNTALMIVRDGNKRYEVRITSDLKRSGTIKFIHEPN